MAAIQITPAVSRPRSAASGTNGLVAGRATPGTMPATLFSAACMSTASSRLRFVLPYSYPMATDNPMTCTRYSGNDCPYVSAPGM